MAFPFDDDDDELIEAVKQRAEKDSDFANKIRMASKQKDESRVSELVKSVVIKIVKAAELAIRVAHIVREVMAWFGY